MKLYVLSLSVALLAACSSPPDNASTTAAQTQTPAPAVPVSAAPSAETNASASGVVESIDPGARTITIAHGPVEALKWPAMTMTFNAPNADLDAIQQGDQVTFEFVSSGMDGTIVAIKPDDGVPIRP